MTLLSRWLHYVNHYVDKWDILGIATIAILDRSTGLVIHCLCVNFKESDTTFFLDSFDIRHPNTTILKLCEYPIADGGPATILSTPWYGDVII